MCAHAFIPFQIPELEGKLRQAHQSGSDVEFLKEKVIYESLAMRFSGMLGLISLFFFFGQVKSLELKLADEQRKVTATRICYYWLCYMIEFYHCYYLCCQNKELERSLRELELQRSTAELKVTS